MTQSAVTSVVLPQAPDRYDVTDQNFVRRTLEQALSRSISTTNTPGAPGAILPAGSSVIDNLSWTGGAWVARAAPEYNVKAYGAVGDGVTDDTVAIQAAVTAAGAYLATQGYEQARAVVNLAGCEYLVSSAIVWPKVQGLALVHGSLKAAPAFPTGHYLVEMQDDATQAPTRVSLFRDVTFDAQRVSGVGCLYLINHAKTLADACFFKRAATYGIRSLNGSGISCISNELIVRHCYFGEWLFPETEGTTAASSTSISVEHNDNLLDGCIIGNCLVGIDLSAQFNIVRGCHIYAGYRPQGLGANTFVPGNLGIHARSQAVHLSIHGNYLDNCVVQLDEPYDTRVTDNLFLVNASAPWTAVVLSTTGSGTVLEGVVIRDNGFMQLGAQTGLLAVGLSGTGTFSAVLNIGPQCDISHNLADPSKFAIASTDGEAITGLNLARRDNGATGLPTPAYDYSRSTIQSSYLTENITSAAITNVPVGREFVLTLQQDWTGGRTVALASFIVNGNGVLWIGGSNVPPVVNTAANALTVLHFRLVASTLVTAWVETPPSTIATIQTPTEAVLVSGVDASQGGIVKPTALTAARLVGAPLNPAVGQRITFQFLQGGAGGYAVTWNAVFVGLTWSNLLNVAGTRSSVSFFYDGTHWNQDGAQAPYV